MSYYKSVRNLSPERVETFLKLHSGNNHLFDSSDDGKSDLDEEYYANKPSPIPDDQLFANIAYSTRSGTFKNSSKVEKNNVKHPFVDDIKTISPLKNVAHNKKAKRKRKKSRMRGLKENRAVDERRKGLAVYQNNPKIEAINGKETVLKDIKTSNSCTLLQEREDGEEYAMDKKFINCAVDGSSMYLSLKDVKEYKKKTEYEKSRIKNNSRVVEQQGKKTKEIELNNGKRTVMGDIATFNPYMVLDEEEDGYEYAVEVVEKKLISCKGTHLSLKNTEAYKKVEENKKLKIDEFANWWKDSVVYGNNLEIEVNNRKYTVVDEQEHLPSVNNNIYKKAEKLNSQTIKNNHGVEEQRRDVTELGNNIKVKSNKATQTIEHVIKVNKEVMGNTVEDMLIHSSSTCRCKEMEEHKELNTGNKKIMDCNDYLIRLVDHMFRRDTADDDSSVYLSSENSWRTWNDNEEREYADAYNIENNCTINELENRIIGSNVDYYHRDVLLNDIESHRNEIKGAYQKTKFTDTDVFCPSADFNRSFEQSTQSWPKEAALNLNMTEVWDNWETFDLQTKLIFQEDYTYMYLLSEQIQNNRLERKYDYNETNDKENNLIIGIPDLVSMDLFTRSCVHLAKFFIGTTKEEKAQHFSIASTLIFVNLWGSLLNSFFPL